MGGPCLIKEHLRTSLCECKSLGNNNKGVAAHEAKAVPKAMVIGNLVGHAKILCELVQSMDDFKQSTQSSTVLGMTELGTDQHMFVKAPSVSGKIKQICQVIEDGMTELPTLIPDLPGSFIPGLKLPGIAGVIHTVIGIFQNPIKGVFDIFKGIVKGIFSMQYSEDKIQMFKTAAAAMEAVAHKRQGSP